MARAANVLRLITERPATGRGGHLHGLDGIADVAVEQGDLTMCTHPGRTTYTQFDMPRLLRLQRRVGQGTTHTSRIAVLERG